MRSLTELLGVHAGLHETFSVHRDYVVGLEFRQAMETLIEFERDLRRHMEAEEKHILPLYEARVGHVLGGDPQFFHLEHKNLLRNLETIKSSLEALMTDPKAGRREAHKFLHQEDLFLHLISHHDLRERNILYPRLDQVVSEEERKAILASCGLQ